MSFWIMKSWSSYIFCLGDITSTLSGSTPYTLLAHKWLSGLVSQTCLLCSCLRYLNTFCPSLSSVSYNTGMTDSWWWQGDLYMAEYLAAFLPSTNNTATIPNDDSQNDTIISRCASRVRSILCLGATAQIQNTVQCLPCPHVLALSVNVPCA